MLDIDALDFLIFLDMVMPNEYLILNSLFTEILI